MQDRKYVVSFTFKRTKVWNVYMFVATLFDRNVQWRGQYILKIQYRKTSDNYPMVESRHFSIQIIIIMYTYIYVCVCTDNSLTLCNLILAVAKLSCWWFMATKHHRTKFRGILDRLHFFLKLSAWNNALPVVGAQ